MDTIKFYIILAWRNIWRNTRRTAITVFAIFLSLYIMIFMTSWMYGFMVQMKKNVTSTIGELQIHNTRYVKNRSFFDQIKNADKLVALCEKKGYFCSQRLYGSGLMSSEKSQKTSGIQVLGINTDKEKKVTELSETKNYQDGRFLTGKEIEEKRVIQKKDVFYLEIPGDFEDESEPAEIIYTNIISEVILGKKLAQNLKTSLGDRIVVLTAGSDGAIGNEILISTGILKNISSVYDSTMAIVDIKTFQRLFSMQGSSSAHEIIIKRAKQIPLEKAKEEIAPLLPEGTTVRTWEEIVPEISDMMEVSEKMLAIMIFIMYIGSGLVVLNSILMVVFERIRELGIMKALGFRPLQVFVLVYLETFFIVLIGTVIALAVSVPSLIFLAEKGIDLTRFAPSGFEISGTVVEPVTKGVINRQSFMYPIVILYIVSIIAVIYPALKAAFIKPLKAIYQR